MKLETLLKTALVLLLMAVCVVITSWMSSEVTEARAQGGGGSEADDWLMVASTLRQGEGLIYVINAKREVLLVYAYHRGKRSRSTRLFTGHFEFLAGRHMKWDVLYSQLRPFPTDPNMYDDIATPAQLKQAYERLSRD
ncbi:MAG: hypothetical protein R6V58_05500 [Planctomycetota bacterium]